jgi:hypothetical protein
VIADMSRKIIVLQRRRKAGQHLSDISRHTILPCEIFFRDDAPAIDPRAS